MQPAPYFADLADNSLPVDAAWLTAGDGTRLRRAIWGKAVRGHVLLLPGRTEYIEKYGLLADPAIAALPGPRLMFAHSMGGCIGLRALLNGFKPDAAVFSGPMWGIAINRYVKPIGEVIARAGSKLGKGALRMPGTKAETYVLSDPFEDNLLTGDAEYWAWMQSHTKARPELGLGGPTLRWLDAAREEFVRFDAAQMPQTPLGCD